MKRTWKFFVMLTLAVLVSAPAMNAQDEDKEKEEKGYEFTRTVEVPVTSVKNQYRSGTCWSFSSISFLEAELLRIGKGEYDLSEMFVIYHSYMGKAEQYVRWHGNNNFAGGGAFHDVLEVYANHGMITEEAYSGKVIGEKLHVHGEMDGVLKGYIDAVIKNRNRKLTPVWDEGLKGILDAYLGEIPETFSYEDKEYSPQQFAGMLDLDPRDYIEIGSFTHHPFYSEFILEVPDNWMLGEIYNVPLDEMMEVIDHALANGYTVAWGADVSEKGFSWTHGVAIVPEEEPEDLSGTEREKWEKLTKDERQKMLYAFEGPVREKTITQEMRQEAFDNYQTTDDHGMLITGKATDQEGNEFYLVKNSWGTEGNDYEGFFYASKPFVAYKTIDIMVHQDAVPKDIRRKLGL